MSPEVPFDELHVAEYLLETASGIPWGRLRRAGVGPQHVIRARRIYYAWPTIIAYLHEMRGRGLWPCCGQRRMADVLLRPAPVLQLVRPPHGEEKQ